MKVIGITGHTKSGKTTLGVRVAAELARNGLVVGAVKHTVEDLDAPPSDATQYGSVSGFVAVMARDGARITVKGEQKMDEILKYFNGDVLIVEGFENNKTFPRIVCLREESEKKDLCEGLEIATASFGKGPGDYDILSDADCGKLAGLIMEKGFIIPALDCGKCAYATCEDMARAIVSGKATLKECVSLNPPLSIKVGDTEMPLNPFTASFCKSAILGMLSSLKGYKKTKITIEIP